MRVVLPVRKVIDSFEKLPGVGAKTAQRLAFYLLHVPQSQLDEFARAVVQLKKETMKCQVCFNIGQASPCELCSSTNRNKRVVCVVERPLDVVAIENSGAFDGVYHVLHGVIDPLNNIGPDELYIEALISRVERGGVDELVMATNPSVEGNATAMYVAKAITDKGIKIKITKLASGLPTGADIEYADSQTIKHALTGRVEV